MRIDRYFGIGVSLLALLFLVFAVPSLPDDVQKTAATHYFTVGPRLFPYIAGALCLIMGALIVLRPSNDHKFGRLADRDVRRRVIVALTISFGYAALLNVLGFTLASILALVLFFVVFGERRWTVIVPMAVLVPVATKLVFLKFFMLEMPAGFFEWLPI